ncbi:hypothetical protein Hypma_010832 [Hypsizygus marmoreus]|uniref:Putative gamma-glutamylcyclotransferase n=1 Tax=Hypsizygus marmoreus TaxID=39966 RepID=A0A369JLA7_HYPMA|nr:hypothetical protein Hypma_010832 [Hypsizygus marmoreus]
MYHNPTEMQERFLASYKDKNFLKTPEPLPPPKYFFYGTLASPATLQQVLGLDQLPTLTDAVIHGYFLKRWGPYLALVRDPDRNIEMQVKGKVYTLTQKEHKAILQDYEGPTYKLVPCRAEHDGIPFLSYVFVWNGPLGELEDLDGRQHCPTKMHPQSSLPPTIPSDQRVGTGRSVMQEKFRQAAMDPNFAELSKPPPWRPEVFFLYGALADPAFLQRLLSLPEVPTFGEATILNAVMKRWGAFPVLTKMDVPNPNLLVTGKIYTVTKEEHVARLTQFVGPNFRLAPCLIKGDDILYIFRPTIRNWFYGV